MNVKLKMAVASAAVVALMGGAAVAGAQLDPGDKSAPSPRATGPSSVFVPITPCRIVDTRSANAEGTLAGPMDPNEVRSYRAFDATATFYKSQGGSTAACGITTQSVAVEATVTALTPSADGYFRAYPSTEGVPNATFLNYTQGVNISNTGTISVAAVGPDLKVKNFGGTTHYVIDVQGYYIPAAT